MGLLMRPFSDRLVISIWGSELLSEKGNKSDQLRKYYEMADCITLTNDKMQRAFEEEFGQDTFVSVHIEPIKEKGDSETCVIKN